MRQSLPWWEGSLTAQAGALGPPGPSESGVCSMGERLGEPGYLSCPGPGLWLSFCI